MKTISKKKSPQYDKSPTEHGFMDECMEKNKDKNDPGAYCASIVDRAKGTTEWREGPHTSSGGNWYKKAQQVINRSRSVYDPEEGIMVNLDELDKRELEDLQMSVQEPEDLELIRLEIIDKEVNDAELWGDMEKERRWFGKNAQYEPFGGSLRHENESDEEYKVRLLGYKKTESSENERLHSEYIKAQKRLDDLKRRLRKSTEILEYVESELEKL